MPKKGTVGNHRIIVIIDNFDIICTRNVWFGQQRITYYIICTANEAKNGKSDVFILCVFPNLGMNLKISLQTGKVNFPCTLRKNSEKMREWFFTSVHWITRLAHTSKFRVAFGLQTKQYSFVNLVTAKNILVVLTSFWPGFKDSFSFQKSSCHPTDRHYLTLAVNCSERKLDLDKAKLGYFAFSMIKHAYGFENNLSCPHSKLWPQCFRCYFSAYLNVNLIKIAMYWCRLISHLCKIVHHCRPVASGGAGGAFPPVFFAKQLTLSQPGGQIMPTTVLLAPRIFRPCDGPVNNHLLAWYWAIMF